MSPEMMRCPFCGAIPDVGIYPETDDSPRGYFCVCPFCSASTAMSSVEAEAIGVWNRRFTAPARGDGAEWVTVPREALSALAMAAASEDQAFLKWDYADATRPKGRFESIWSIAHHRLGHTISAMLSAPAAPAGDGWRPIDSAPRDGTPILACSVNHDAREVVCWQDGLPSETVTEEPCEGWVNDGSLKDRFWANPRWFTHWQPLPLPPAPVEEG